MNNCFPTLRRLLFLALVGCSGTAGAQQYTALDCGMQFTLALRSDSTLWGWGYNGNDQLTNAFGIQVDAPTQLAPATKWIRIAAGSFHSLAISADSALWGWGYNSNGQISSSSATVGAPEVVAEGRWRSASGGFAHSAAIRADGTLWTTGYNYGGQLGVGDTLDRLEWTQVGTDADWKMVSCGGYHTLAIKNDGSLWAWGYNANGQVGVGATSGSIKTPQPVSAGTSWSMVSAGFEFSAALRPDGTAWAWGFNGNAQLGQGGALPSSQYTPLQVLTDTNWRYLAAGSSYVLAIRTDSTLWGWGYNGRGQLGMPSSVAVQAPMPVGEDADWAMIAAADGGLISGMVFGLHSVGYKTGGTGVCTAGDNQAGQLGLNGGGSSSGYEEVFNCSVGQIATAVGTVTAGTELLQVWPNPATERISVRLTTGQPGAALTLVTPDGRVVWSGHLINGQATVEAREFPRGLYFVQLAEANGQVIAIRRTVIQ